MGCGSSGNQVHDTNEPIKNMMDTGSKIMMNEEEMGPFCVGKCFMFGQSSGQRKVVEYDSEKNFFKTLSSRIRIPTPKLKLEPIEILYEESQEIILPQVFNRSPKPPFNQMFATFVMKNVIFFCGGTVYEGDYVSDETYFYTLDKGEGEKRAAGSRLQKTNKMIYGRYGHMGIFRKEKLNGIIYIFGGKNSQNQCLSVCERFSINQKKWSEIAPLKKARSEGFAICFLERIYVFGGVSNFKEYLQNIDVYEPSKDSWETLDIKLHRGIRSALIVTVQPNQILIFGGISAEQAIQSVIRVNLAEETYQWETDLKQKMHSLKSAHFKNNITIFGGNKSNEILEYHCGHKTWRTLSYGFKNFIPISDIGRFTCVSEPLHVDFKSPTTQKFKKQNPQAKKSLLMFGNQNYPAILSLSLEHKQKLCFVLYRVPMKIRLASYSGVVDTPAGYFITGGVGDCMKNSKFSSYLFNPQINSTVEIEPMNCARFNFGICYFEDKVYAFGGLREINIPIKQCEGYDFSTKRWFPVAAMERARFALKAYPIKSIYKILLIGGRQLISPSALIQLYDPQTNTITHRKQFAELLGDQEVEQIFIKQLSQQELQLSTQRRALTINVVTISPTILPVRSMKPNSEQAEEKVGDQGLPVDDPNGQESSRMRDTDERQQDQKVQIVGQGQNEELDNIKQFEYVLPQDPVQKKIERESPPLRSSLEKQPEVIEYQSKQKEQLQQQEDIEPSEYLGFRLFLYKNNFENVSSNKVINKCQVANLYIHKKTLDMKLRIEKQRALERGVFYAQAFLHNDQHYFISTEGGFKIDPESDFSQEKLHYEGEISSSSDSLLTQFKEMEQFSMPRSY